MADNEPKHCKNTQIKHINAKLFKEKKINLKKTCHLKIYIIIQIAYKYKKNEKLIHIK